MATTKEIVRVFKRNYIQIFLFLFVNSLFVIKYFQRAGLNSFASLVLYTCFFSIVLIVFAVLSEKISEKTYRIAFAVLLIVMILTIIGFLIGINPYNIRVDRWSAIHNFIQNLFNGVYPYAARTHLGGYGSPFPIWQLYHIPFYLLGNVGFGLVFSVLLLTLFLIWYFDTYQQALFYIILLAISPAFWYEVAVRSDLIYNFIICFIAIAFVYKKRFKIQNQALGLGILCGLFLSTRFSVIIPFVVFLLPDFLMANLKQKFVFSFSVFITFLITFLPFIFWNFKALFFFKYSPFFLQTRQGAFMEVIILLVLVLLFSMRWKNDLKLCSSYISIIFVVFISLTFMHRMINDSFENGLFSSYYDLTYFNMPLPFIIFAITNQNISFSPVSENLNQTNNWD